MQLLIRTTPPLTTQIWAEQGNLQLSASCASAELVVVKDYVHDITSIIIMIVV